jgi:hypothetical protein
MKHVSAFLLGLISVIAVFGFSVHAQTTTVTAIFDFTGGSTGDPCTDYISHPLITGASSTGSVIIGPTFNAGGTEPECNLFDPAGASLTIDLAAPASAVTLKYHPNCSGSGSHTITLSLDGAVADSTTIPIVCSPNTFTRSIPFDSITFTRGGNHLFIDDIEITWHLTPEEEAALLPPWPGDDRINPDAAASYVIYAQDNLLVFYTPHGVLIGTVEVGACPDANTLIFEAGGVRLYHLSSCQLQAMAPTLDGTKTYVMLFTLGGGYTSFER